MIRFLTYNILDGGRGRETELFEIIGAQEADIVLLQEVMGQEFVRDLAARLHLDWFIAESNSRRTIALLTRLPIAGAGSYHPRILRHTCLNAVVEYAPGKTLDLYGIHLCAPAYTLPLEMYRLAELHAILALVQKSGSDKKLIAGDLNSIAPGDTPDFNHLPFSIRLSVFLHGGHVARQVVAYLQLRGFTDVYRALHPQKSGYTLPAIKPNTRLDYCFVNEGMRQNIRSCNVVELPEGVKRASDHLPVCTELEL